MASAPRVPRTSIISFRSRKLLARSSPRGRRARALTRPLTGLSPRSGQNSPSSRRCPRTIWPVSAERRLPRRLADYAGARSSRTPDTTASLARSACSVPASSTTPGALRRAGLPPATRKPATGNEPGPGDNATERHRGGRAPAREAEAAERLAVVLPSLPGTPRGQVQACRGGSGTGRTCNSIRVFPSVFGFTQSRPRNSATPSS